MPLASIRHQPGHEHHDFIDHDQQQQHDRHQQVVTAAGINADEFQDVRFDVADEWGEFGDLR